MKVPFDRSFSLPCEGRNVVFGTSLQDKLEDAMKHQAEWKAQIYEILTKLEAKEITTEVR